MASGEDAKKVFQKHCSARNLRPLSNLSATFRRHFDFFFKSKIQKFRIFDGIVKFRVFFRRDFEFLYVLAKSRPDPMGFNVFCAVFFCILFDILFNFYFCIFSLFFGGILIVG